MSTISLTLSFTAEPDAPEVQELISRVKEANGSTNIPWAHLMIALGKLHLANAQFHIAGVGFESVMYREKPRPRTDGNRPGRSTKSKEYVPGRFFLEM